MKRKWALFVAVSASFSGALPARAPAYADDVVARCNYDFDVTPTTYDRGSVEVTKSGTGFRLQLVQDDEITTFDKIQASTASGDQARSMIKSDSDFAKFVSQAHIFPEQIVSVDAYVVPATGPATGILSGDPQARFFAFYGASSAYLGGFGTLGKEPFSCDWVEQN